MNRDGARFHRLWSGSCIFWFPVNRKVLTAISPAGKLRSAHLNKKSSVQPGNLRAEIFAGLSMAPSVRAMFTKTGKKRWRSAAPVRFSTTFFDHPSLFSSWLPTKDQLVSSGRWIREGCTNTYRPRAGIFYKWYYKKFKRCILEERRETTPAIGRKMWNHV